MWHLCRSFPPANASFILHPTVVQYTIRGVSAYENTKTLYTEDRRGPSGGRHAPPLLCARCGTGQRGPDVLPAVCPVPTADLRQRPAGHSGAGYRQHHRRADAAAAGGCGGRGALLSDVRRRQPEPPAAVVQPDLFHLVPHALHRLPDALAAQGVRPQRAGEHAADPAAQPAFHGLDDPRHRPDAGAGGGRPPCAALPVPHRPPVGDVHQRLGLPALHHSGPCHGHFTGDIVPAGTGPAPPPAGGTARRGQLAGGVAAAEHGLFLLCGKRGPICAALRLHRHCHRGAAVAVYVGPDPDFGCGAVRRPDTP